MKVDQEDVSRRMARFEQTCRGADIRLTHQRLEIFREVAQTGDHPDADTILQRLRRRMPTVSLDTVYRTLWLLNDLGLINTLGPARERTRFDANLSRHHHFVCTECGLTRDFYSDELNELSLPDTAHAFGEIVSTQVEIRGVCRECANEDPDGE